MTSLRSISKASTVADPEASLVFRRFFAIRFTSRQNEKSGHVRDYPEAAALNAKIDERSQKRNRFSNRYIRGDHHYLTLITSKRTGYPLLVANSAAIASELSNCPEAY